MEHRQEKTDQTLIELSRNFTHKKIYFTKIKLDESPENFSSILGLKKCILTKNGNLGLYRILGTDPELFNNGDIKLSLLDIEPNQENFYFEESPVYSAFLRKGEEIPYVGLNWGTYTVYNE